MAEQQPIEASPEEARFLRRFVRRTTLPWFACVGALASLALGVALSPAPPSAPAAAAAPGAAHDSEEHEDLREEIASLRQELASLRAAQPGRETQPVDLEPRVAKLESELSSRPAAAAPASASPEDLVVIRDRVYALESRLYDVEKIQAEVRRADPRGSAPIQAVPAAPAP